MLAGSNDKILLANGIDEKYIYFYQVWQELLDPRTLDVYQYRVMNSFTALSEIQSVIEKTITGLFTSDANIEACREEMLYLLNNDRILSKYYLALLNRLRNVFGKKAPSTAEKNRLLQHVKYAVRILEENYLKNAVIELKTAILNSDTYSIEAISNIIVSQMIYLGWSTKALSKLLRFFKSEATFDEKWHLFENALLNTDSIQHCVLINVPFRNQGVEEHEQSIRALKNMGLEIKTHDEIIADYSSIRGIERRINADKKYIAIEVNAKDVYAAAHMAISKVSEYLNFASFYNLIIAWDLDTVVAVSINIQNKYFQSFPVKQIYATNDYLDSSVRIFEDTKVLFSSEQYSVIRDKLQGVFGYTNISRASLFQEEKYMMLWVALESLARTNMYADIISNIKQTVPAAISLRYVYRIVRNFIEDCKRCRIDLSFSSFAVDVEQADKEELVKNVIGIFKDSALFAELKSKCGVNQLLSKRIDDINVLVSDGVTAKEKIENHYKHVEWQIQRLYRIRNEIAHAALREQTSLVIYIEHLYHYLSAYISEIVIYLVEKGSNSFEQTLCMIRDNYDVFIEMAKNKEFTLIDSDVLRTGIINLVTC